LVALVVALWLLTVVMGLFAIPALADSLLIIYSFLFGGRGLYGATFWAGVTLRNLVILLLAILFVAVVIGGGEYHAAHFNERSSWRLFARTLAVEVGALLLAAFLS
jgi:hypothetical protein